jgi:Rieske Fe-S protein
MPPDSEQMTVPPDGRPLEAQPAWRQDFPVDWPQDAYIERRDFVKFLVLTSLAFTVGQFWIAMRNWRRRRAGEPETVRIASLATLSVGSVMTFTYPTEHDPCVLIRPRADVLLAYGQKCTHLSCAVIPDVPSDTIRCPCHDGRFDLSTGRPVAGPPRRPLTRIRLQVRGDDIYATGVEERVA